MENFAIDSIKKRTFDAIVIGSGISCGWAVKELTGKGLQTLALTARAVDYAVKELKNNNL